MALLIIPVAIALGWLLPSPRRAAVATQTVGFGALVVLSLVWSFSDLAVSITDTFVLVFGTPVAGVLASWIARWRLSHGSRTRGDAGPPTASGASPSGR